MYRIPKGECGSARKGMNITQRWERALPATFWKRGHSVFLLHEEYLPEVRQKHDFVIFFIYEIRMIK